MLNQNSYDIFLFVEEEVVGIVTVKCQKPQKSDDVVYGYHLISNEYIPKTK